MIGDIRSGADAVGLAGELQPDVVLDAPPPDLGGPDPVPLIAAVAPAVDVVNFSGARPAGSGQSAGVLAWLTKGEPMGETTDRLLAVLGVRHEAGR